MPYRTASTRINKILYDQFNDYCEKNHCTIHSKLKETIEGMLEQREVSESNNERSKLGKNVSINGQSSKREPESIKPSENGQSEAGNFWARFT